jgi:micrococcal nuclease
MVPMAPFFMPGPLLKSLLLLPLLIVGLQAAASPAACNSPAYDETVTVRHVHDGDTVVLTDGRKLRLLGYNTPEVARDRRPAEPLAIAAQQQLQQWIAAGKARLQLKFDHERQDHYGRTLAHAFTQDGHSISHLMLQQGLATSLIMPPNLAFADCYTEAESQARTQALGVWTLPSYQPVALTDLKKHKDRYTVLQARVFELDQDTHGLNVWLGGYEFATKIRIFIHNDDLALFPLQQVKNSKGRLLEVRGWLHLQKKGWTMRLRHPSNLQISDLQIKEQSVTNQRQPL